MASVQELLLAANAKKSPLASLLEGGLQGYSKGSANSMDRMKDMIAMENEREKRERRADMDRQIRAQTEDAVQGSLKKAGPGSAPVLPGQKMKTVISQDENGNYSRRLETIEVAPKSLKPEPYLDAQGKTRIGKWDPDAGLVKSDDDSFAPVPGGALGDQVKRAELSNKLRDDLNKATTPFITMRNYYSKIQSAAKDPTGASDWALVYGFNKMLDESSAVRDPEVQNTIDTGSFAQTASAAIEKLRSGKKLDDDVRANLVAESRKLFAAMEPYQKRTVEEYRGIAKRQGLDERDVIIDASFIPSSADEPKPIKLPGAKAGRLAELRAKAGAVARPGR
jgi:hypothetical protein